MSVSRVDKLVRELKGMASLAEASDVREVPITLLLGDGDARKLEPMALASLSLALRCLRGPVRISAPQQLLTAQSSSGIRTVRERLEIEAARDGQSSRVSFSHEPIEGAPCFGVGRPIAGGFFAEAAGWVAGINCELPKEVPAVTPAAVFAVCAAFAQFFRTAVLGDIPSIKHSWTFSLEDFTRSPAVPSAFTLPQVHLGRIGLLGAGAIGSGFAFNLVASGWAADLTIIDRERYDEPNWETTLGVGLEDILRRGAKAPTLAEFVASRGTVAVDSIVAEVSETSPLLAQSRDFFVCAVDNPETRRTLDKANARLLLNGGVGGSSLDAGHVLWSSHGHGDDPLSTLYPQRSVDTVGPSKSTPNDIQDECSRIAYQGVSMAAPFVGLACGALLLASCAQVQLGHTLPVNYVKLDLLGRQEFFRRESRHAPQRPPEET